MPKLIGLFVLGGLQGLMGWYMVKSGLVDDPHVSQYRLTAHLLLAFLIFAGMFWIALDLLRAPAGATAAETSWRYRGALVHRLRAAHRGLRRIRRRSQAPASLSILFR